MTDHDPWGGTSGLRDDFDGTITLAKFTYDSEYNNGQTLIARIEIEPDDGGDAEILKLSTGSGWEDDEKGAKAKREDGSDPKGFNKSSNYQRFITAALETDFAGTMRKTVPWDASVWVGEKFHFVRREFPAFNDEPGSKKPEVTGPVEYLGTADGKKATSKSSSSEKKSGPTPAEKAAAAKAKAAAAKGGDEGSDDPLVALAKECESHDEFIEKAYAIEGFDADARENDIVDPAFYEANHG